MSFRRAAFLLASLLSLVVPQTVSAGGLYLSERGTRALGRGGAFVAGADGIEAVGHNPAGIRGTGFLGELTVPFSSAQYDRVLAVDDGEGTIRYVRTPRVSGESELIPFPTLVGAFTSKNERYTVAGGLVTPTFTLLGFPSTVGDGEPSPARYTLSGFTDSRPILGGLWARIQLHEKVQLGFGVHALIGTVRSTVGFTLSPPDRVLAAPEDPDYDATGRVTVGPLIAPSASLGFQFTPLDWLRLGIAGEAPIRIDTDATFDVRLPASAAFETVEVQGKKAHLSMWLPAILRMGAEFALTDELRIELAWVREFWSLHDDIDVRPDDIRITGIPGGPENFVLPRINIPRNFQDADSLRAGFELDQEFFGMLFTGRAGIAHDSSAVPPAYVSLSSMDFDKWLFSLGGGVAFTKRIRGDVSYVYVLMEPTTLAPEDARIQRINPLSGNAPPDYVNGGRYEMSAHVFSGALKYQY